MRTTITESAIHNMVDSIVEGTITELNHMLYGNDWYFDEPDYQTETVHVVAYYYNEETEEELEKEFDIDIEVPGSYEKEWDDDCYYAAFVPDDNVDYYDLVKETGEIPETLEDGFELQDWKIE